MFTTRWCRQRDFASWHADRCARRVRASDPPLHSDFDPSGERLSIWRWPTYGAKSWCWSHAGVASLPQQLLADILPAVTAPAIQPSGRRVLSGFATPRSRNRQSPSSRRRAGVSLQERSSPAGQRAPNTRAAPSRARSRVDTSRHSGMIPASAGGHAAEPTALMFLAGALAATSLASAQTTYRWVDQKTSQTVFSDQPPPPPERQRHPGRQQKPAAPNRKCRMPRGEALRKVSRSRCTPPPVAPTPATRRATLLNQRGVPASPKMLNSGRGPGQVAKQMGSTDPGRGSEPDR